MPIISGTFNDNGTTFPNLVKFVPVDFPKAFGNVIASDKPLEAYLSTAGTFSVFLKAGFFRVHLDGAETYLLIEVGAENADIVDIVTDDATISGAANGGKYFATLTAAKAATSLTNGFTYFIASSATFIGGWFRYDLTSAATADDSDSIALDTLSGRLLRIL